MAYKNNDFKDVMKNRHSIRQFNPDVKIPKEEMLAIINDSLIAPTSGNMQPLRFLIIESPEGKEKLKPLVRMNGLQNDTSSAMILVYGDLNSFENKAETIFGRTVQKGFMTQEYKDSNFPILTHYYGSLPQKDFERDILVDGGLFAMQLMLTARAYGYETCPIGGFERDVILGTFDIDSSLYMPVIMIAIGMPDKDKGYTSYRLPAEELSSWG